MLSSHSEHHRFFLAVVAWQKKSGRHDLPWQNTQDPYRVWLSEIMLQQTQVSTVLGYYECFLMRFPSVEALAHADLDEVLRLWAGLGYYSRARNLHQCARAVAGTLGGRFPASSDALQQLPGIGPSTAAAVAAFCFNERVAIFDGNVKRVVARFFGYDSDLASAAAVRGLQDLVIQLLPKAEHAVDMPAYTQGLMDLGATVCTLRRPNCGDCPLADACVARRTGNPTKLPVSTKRIKRQTVEWWWLVLQRSDGAVYLVQRPSKGIWAGLYCFPEYASAQALRNASMQPMGGCCEWMDPLTHALTHRELILRPTVCTSHAPDEVAAVVADHARGVWVVPGQPLPVAVPTPVDRLLSTLAQRA